jgi:hypothetical protein
MATTTTNYGWAIPTSTDLVKDGATAIATLGSAIDTSVNTALGTKKAGMVLLNTTSFSGVSSQSINSVFTSTYTNYRIVFTCNTPTADNNLRLRWRASGTDNTSTTYFGMLVRTSAAGTNAALNTNGESSVQLLTMDAGNTERLYNFSMDVYNPQISAFTTHTMLSLGLEVDGNQYYGYAGGGHHRTAASYDGFTLFPSSGNMTGSVSVYGYNI